MRFLRCLAAVCALLLPALSQESGAKAAEAEKNRLPKLREMWPRALRGPCSIPMPNPAKRSTFRFLPGEPSGQGGPRRREPELPMIPPPPGRFAFRELKAPAPPCDEVGVLRPVPFPNRDREPKRDSEPNPKR